MVNFRIISANLTRFFIMSWLVLNIRDLVVDLDISLFAHMFRRDDYFQRAGTLARVRTDDSDSKMSKSHEDSCHVVSSTRFMI